MATKRHKYDVLIIGSGAAGLTCALKLSDQARIAVVSKDVITEGSTYYAQGGIAAVLDKLDTVQSHVCDTLKAGAGLCKEEIVRFTVENSRDAINWLVEQGVSFSSKTDVPQEYHLTKEGGHSHRRVIHSADATGKAVATTLAGAALSKKNVHVLEKYYAVDLITTKKLGIKEGENRCIGAYLLNVTTSEIELIEAKYVILATGGASKVYLYTSNPDISSGDGIAMAWRAGCSVTNMEFNQFHPTCLYHQEARSFLISEALRGEGAVLKLPNGERFMPKFDDRAELAPRDIVARAIDYEMKRLGINCVYLDISHKPASFIKSHFPNIFEKLLPLGINITKDPIPVVPAAHYTCGGITVNKNSQTDIAGLYAAGEVASTGLHGANRMASNSLLECLVFGMSAASDINNKGFIRSHNLVIPDWDESKVSDSDEEIVVTHNWHELRTFMWNYVGIVRTNNRLERAKRRIELLEYEINEYYSKFRITKDLLELRNLVTVAGLIVESAISRKESRGLHFNLDYPQLAKEAKDVILRPNLPV